MNSDKRVKVSWLDAVVYFPETPNKFDLKPTEMETEGVLFSEDENRVVIKDPKTIYKKDGKQVAKQSGATFLFIPTGMISKIEKRT